MAQPNVIDKVMILFFGAPIHPLTYYVSEFIHKLPVFKEEIEQISILQKFQEMHGSIITT